MAKQKRGSGARDETRADSRAASPAGSTPDGAAGALVYGIGVAQLDALDQALRMIGAHGDLLAVVRSADLAPGTLPALGQALLADAQAMRRVVDRIGTQRLDREDGDRSVVEEGRAAYRPAHLRPTAVAGPASVH